MDAAAPANEHRFPCDACGSDLRFDPASGALVCDHCGNTEPIEKGTGPWGTIRELDLEAALAADLPEVEIEVARVLSCPNCGA